jgi:hypothetical protein
MRSIQNFHMDDPKRNYADIGYSFVIDNADGTIFEGRSAGIAGAHTKGDNTRSHAICVMGHFNKIQPSAKAIDSIVALAIHGREQGWWTPTCRGHKEFPSARTECPGTHLFARLGEIRTRVGGGQAPAPGQVEEIDMTTDELLDALESKRGKAILRSIIAAELATVIRGDKDKPNGGTHPDNLQNIHETVKAINRKLPG